MTSPFFASWRLLNTHEGSQRFGFVAVHGHVRLFGADGLPLCLARRPPAVAAAATSARDAVERGRSSSGLVLVPPLLSRAWFCDCGKDRIAALDLWRRPDSGRGRRQSEA